MITKIFHSILDDIAIEARDDVIGLWVIPRRLQIYGLSHLDLKSSSLKILRELIVNRGLKFGSIEDGGFHPWTGDSETVINRVAGEWDKLEDLPDIGDIGWLSCL